MKKTANRDFPDEADVAAAYDDLNRRFPIPFVDDMSGKPRDRELLKRFSVLCGDGRICDLGCGTGKVARFLHDRGHDVVGIDISEEAISQAKALHSELEFEQMSFARTTFEGGTFSGLTSFFGIIHTHRADLPAVVGELARILRPEGYLLLACYEGEGTAHFSRAEGAPIDMVTTLVTEAEIEQLLSAAKFEVVESYCRGPYKYEFKCSRLFVVARLLASQMGDQT